MPWDKSISKSMSVKIHGSSSSDIPSKAKEFLGGFRFQYVHQVKYNFSGGMFHWPQTCVTCPKITMETTVYPWTSGPQCLSAQPQCIHIANILPRYICRTFKRLHVLCPFFFVQYQYSSHNKKKMSPSCPTKWHFTLFDKSVCSSLTGKVQTKAKMWTYENIASFTQWEQDNQCSIYFTL